MIRSSAVRVVFLGAALALAGGLRPSEAEAQVAMDGRTLFQQGRAAYDGQRWEEALGLFQQSMAALPSPNTRLYVGRCLRALGRYGEAWQELSRAATEANARRAQEPRFTPTAEAALAESMALTDRIAYVVVEVPNAPPGTTVTLNGRVLSNEEFNTLLAVDGNTAAVEAVAPGVVPYRGTSQVTAGHQARFVVRFGAPDSPVSATESQPMVTLVQSGVNRPTLVSTGGGWSPWRSVGLTALGVGVALGIGGVVTGLMAQSNESTLIEQCGGGCGAGITAEQRALVSDGNTLVTATNALWISGGVLAAAGLVTFLVAGGRSDEVFTPTLAVGLGTVSLRGRF